jgi:hypothetical protein
MTRSRHQVHCGKDMYCRVCIGKCSSAWNSIWDHSTGTGMDQENNFILYLFQFMSGFNLDRHNWCYYNIT